MSMLRALLTMINTVIGEDYRIATYLDPLLDLSMNAAENELVSNMHAIADDYATRALQYLDEHPGGRDQSMASAGMVLVDATGHALADLNSIKYPVLQHDAQHSTWATSRAATAVIVWARVVLGHIEAERRIHKAIQRVGIIPNNDAEH